MSTTTETVQHTPTPWGIEDTDDRLWIGPMRYRGGKIADIVTDICIEGYTEDSKAHHRANAAFIVRACNNHEALVAALKPFAALINWADVSESDADDEAFLTGTRNDIESFCGAKTAVLTVGDLRRAKAALATATQ